MAKAADQRDVKMVTVDGVRYRPEDVPGDDGKRPQRKQAPRVKNKGIGSGVAGDDTGGNDPK